jgi:ribosomal protein L35AE/L33A
MSLSDDQAALHVAHLLDAEPWHRLPATALLRLVNILCYDIAQVSAVYEGGVGRVRGDPGHGRASFAALLPLFSW